MRPVTEEQWQDAVDTADALQRIDTAEFLLQFELGRLFGLVSDDFEVDIQACVDTLEDGRRLGITPGSK